MPDLPKENPEDKNLRSAGVVDPAARAAKGLETALGEMTANTDAEIVIVDENLRRAEETKKVEEQAAAAAEHAAVIEMENTPPPPPSDRKKIRMVLTTTDTSFFIEGSKAQMDYIEIAEYFDEIHIIVINLQTEALPESLRVALNIWVYSTNSRSYMMGIWNAYNVAKRQLVLSTTGFRGDIIVGSDAFESGFAAHLIARKYNCPLQIQVLVDPFEEGFANAREGNNWRLMGARYVIPRATCVFVRSSRIQSTIEHRYRKLKDRISRLPPFRDITFFRDAAPIFNLREKYPQFKFVMLAVSPLDPHSKVDFIIDACTTFLQQYPTVALIIVGEGSERAGLVEKVAAAGLQDRIIFQSEKDDLVSYMKTANLLVNAVSTEEQDMLVAAAAAAGLPILTVAGEMSTALFEDGVNAFVCPVDDISCFQNRIREFLNNNQLRSAFAINGKNKVFSVVEQDVGAYHAAFVNILETCVLNASSSQAPS